jgi:hypothetical protein
MQNLLSPTAAVKAAPAIRAKFRSLIPPLAPEELAQLEANIVADGCRDPLVTWKGTLLDGHNRLTICQKNGIAFKTVEVELADEDAALLWIIDNQKGRRNVSEIDRIMLQSKREEIVARKAKANKVEAGKQTGRGHAKVLANLPKPINTRRECAAAAGVGERTYDAGKLVWEAAINGEISEDTVEAIRRGKTAIHRVAKDIKETRQREARAEKRTAAAKGVKLDSRIIVGDFRKHADKIPDGSLSLIFTDPPYDKEASKLFSGLADFASGKLADGGSLVMYLGHLQLPAAFAAFSGKLRHWWTCACVHSGDNALMREYGIRVGWKPMLWFVKGTRDDKAKIVNDTVTGKQEKTHHDWQQSVDEASYWIDTLCSKNGVVCDPFLGGGTTAAAAQKLGRKWIGIEFDPETARTASARLAPESQPAPEDTPRVQTFDEEVAAKGGAA